MGGLRLHRAAPRPDGRGCRVCLGVLLPGVTRLRGGPRHAQGQDGAGRLPRWGHRRRLPHVPRPPRGGATSIYSRSIRPSPSCGCTITDPDAAGGGCCATTTTPIWPVFRRRRPGRRNVACGSESAATGATMPETDHDAGAPDAGASDRPAPLLVEHRDGVDWVTLNSPDRLNAVSAAMREALHDYLDAVERRDDVRVIVRAAPGGASARVSTSRIGPPPRMRPGRVRATRCSPISGAGVSWSSSSGGSPSRSSHWCTVRQPDSGCHWRSLPTSVFVGSRPGSNAAVFIRIGFGGEIAAAPTSCRAWWGRRWPGSC